VTTDPDLEALAAAIARPDESAAAAAREARPAEALSRGRLDDLAEWLAAVQGSVPARPLERVRMVVVGDGTDVAARARVAAASDVEVRPLAVPDDDAASALRAGIAAVDAEVDSGTELLVVAAADPAADVPASALVGLLTRTDASSVTRRGATIDDAGWMSRCAMVRDTMRRGRPVVGDRLALLDGVGSPDLAATTGVLLQAAARRTPVVLDGVATAAAALVAQRVAFRAVDWWVASHRSPEPAHALALDRLSLQPLLDLSIRAEDGTGALLAVHVLRAAAAVPS